ncbi:MAG: DUF5305 domain-containing protein [Bacilli bacterium]|nr:DUF5305 domain-containing protein [Bacilli bacterium]
MKQRSKYDGMEKQYYVEKKKLNVKAWFFILILPAFALLLLSAYCMKDAINLDKNQNNVSYHEIGKIDYKVYLKENNYYTEKFLPKEMKYIANLINTINVDFNYEMHSTNNLDYNYTYKITANLLVTDKNDKTKVLYEKPSILLEETTKKITANNFIINEDIDIDYDEYNNYVNAFKKDYALTVDSKLILTLEVKTNGTYQTVKDLKTNNQLQISIPLSEQTIDITMDSKELNDKGVLTSETSFQINNIILFIAGITLGIVSITLLGIALYLFVTTRRKKDLYHTTVDKYLKEYDRVIITSKQPNVDERLFDEIIRVMTIEELLDLHDMTKEPIIYYEVIPNEKSYFIVIHNRLLYKLTITKAWLERNQGDDN